MCAEGLCWNENPQKTKELNQRMLRLASGLSDSPRKNREILLSLSDIYVEKRNLRKASNCFFSAIGFKPDGEDELDESLRSRMKDVMDAGHEDEAHRVWISGMEIIKNEGYSESAKEYYLSSLQKYPYCAHLHDTYGTISSYLVSIASGIEHMKAAIAIDPLDSSYYLNLAELYIEQGQYQEAVDALSQVQALLKNRPALLTSNDEEYLNDLYNRLFRMAVAGSKKWTKTEILQEALRNFYHISKQSSNVRHGCFYYRHDKEEEKISPETVGWLLFYFDDGGNTAHYYVMTKDYDIALLKDGRTDLSELIASPYSSAEIVAPDVYPQAKDLLYADILLGAKDFDNDLFNRFIQELLFDNVMKQNVINIRNLFAEYAV
jgi:tetratricopeptide (TPR) repeat protein